MHRRQSSPVTIVVELMVAAVLLLNPSASFSAPPQSTRPITEEERIYLGAAGSYLKEANSLGTKVAQTMNGLNDGSSTLGDVRDAISTAQSVENAGYHVDYLDRIKNVVPASLNKEQREIDETHRLFQAAMEEYLEYWKDSNDAHIVSGAATFKRCILTMNSAIADANSAMKSLTPR